MKNFNLKNNAVAAALITTVLMSSCKQDIIAPSSSNGISTQSRSIFSTINKNFDNYPDGIYTIGNYTNDFGNDSKINGEWRTGAQYIINKTFRVKLEANVVGSTGGGCIAETDIMPRSDYQLSFDTKFDPIDEFSEGGKIGWGFAIGKGAADGNNNGGLGASVRIMWKRDTLSNGTIRHVFKPYLYYANMPNASYGDDYGSTYFGSLDKTSWYNIYIHVTTNTAHTGDGYIKVLIKRSTDTVWTTVLDKHDIKWTYDGSLINKLTFDTFRGGKGALWASGNPAYIFFDNIFLR